MLYWKKYLFDICQCGYHCWCKFRPNVTTYLLLFATGIPRSLQNVLSQSFNLLRWLTVLQMHSVGTSVTSYTASIAPVSLCSVMRIAMCRNKHKLAVITMPKYNSQHDQGQSVCVLSWTHNCLYGSITDYSLQCFRPLLVMISIMVMLQHGYCYYRNIMTGWGAHWIHWYPSLSCCRRLLFLWENYDRLGSSLNTIPVVIMLQHVAVTMGTLWHNGIQWYLSWSCYSRLLLVREHYDMLGILLNTMMPLTFMVQQVVITMGTL